MENIFDLLKEFDYEQIIFHNDNETGLKAITVIHDTTLGPALGGSRYWQYDNDADAIRDALRLARGMTYKNAASGLGLGGGKSVIIKDPDNQPNEEAMFRAFGRYVEGLNGRYITAADVGTAVREMDYIYSETKNVVGTGLKPGTSGNPSPATAHGVYMGMKAAAKKAFGTDSLEGRTILLEGLGKVGSILAEKILAEGARVIATDIFEEPRERGKELGCEIVSPEELFTYEADIYSPNALGATVNDDMIAKLKELNIKVIAGGANNQLAEERHGDMVHEAGIIYTPDFILNSGGVIQVADEFNGGWEPERSNRSVENIYHQIEKVFEIAEAENISTADAAYHMAEERIAAVKHTKKIFTRHNKSLLDN